MSTFFLTTEGLEKIKQELEHIKVVKLPGAKKRFADAKEFGYTVNDFEYSDSKAECDFYNSRIVHLTNMIETAKII